jgi:hypothetical protein
MGNVGSPRPAGQPVDRTDRLLGLPPPRSGEAFGRLRFPAPACPGCLVQRGYPNPQRPADFQVMVALALSDRNRVCLAIRGTGTHFHKAGEFHAQWTEPSKCGPRDRTTQRDCADLQSRYRPRGHSGNAYAAPEERYLAFCDRMNTPPRRTAYRDGQAPLRPIVAACQKGSQICLHRSQPARTAGGS